MYATGKTENISNKIIKYESNKLERIIIFLLASFCSSGDKAQNTSYTQPVNELQITHAVNDNLTEEINSGGAYGNTFYGKQGTHYHQKCRESLFI
jgi:hypothetical protein